MFILELVCFNLSTLSTTISSFSYEFSYVKSNSRSNLNCGLPKFELFLKPPRLAKSVEALTLQVWSHPRQKAESLIQTFRTIWPWGIGDWELFSQGISAQAPMWDMQESRTVLNYRMTSRSPDQKYSNRQIFFSSLKALGTFIAVLLNCLAYNWQLNCVAFLFKSWQFQNFGRPKYERFDE